MSSDTARDVWIVAGVDDIYPCKVPSIFDPFDLLPQLMSVFAFTVGSFGDILEALQLIIKISGTLRSNHDIARQCQKLLLELQSLFPILSLTQSFLNDYQNTSLGETLTHVIEPQLVQCHIDLANFHTKIENLNLNCWSAMWKRVVWAGTSEAENLRNNLLSIRCNLISHLFSLLA